MFPAYKTTIIFNPFHQINNTEFTANFTIPSTSLNRKYLIMTNVTFHFITCCNLKFLSTPSFFNPRCIDDLSKLVLRNRSIRWKIFITIITKEMMITILQGFPTIPTFMTRVNPVSLDFCLKLRIQMFYSPHNLTLN